MMLFIGTHKHMKSRNNSDLGSKPVVIIIGLVASCLGIFAFVTGKQSIPDLLRNNQNSPAATDTPFLLPTETPYLTSTSYPTEKPFFIPSTPLPNLDGTPSHWLPTSTNIPDEFSVYRRLTYNNAQLSVIFLDLEDVFGAPLDIYNKLEEWGRVTGDYNTYINDEYYYSCSSTTGLAFILLSASKYKDSLGARTSLDWFSEGYKQVDGFDQQTISYFVGDIAYYTSRVETSNCRDSQIEFRTIDISFQRYNIYAEVKIYGINGLVNESSMEKFAEDFAQIIDVNLVFFAK